MGCVLCPPLKTVGRWTRSLFPLPVTTFTTTKHKPFSSLYLSLYLSSVKAYGLLLLLPLKLIGYLACIFADEDFFLLKGLLLLLPLKAKFIL